MFNKLNNDDIDIEIKFSNTFDKVDAKSLYKDGENKFSTRKNEKIAKQKAERQK